MSVRRLANIPGFSIDRAAAAGNDPGFDSFTASRLLLEKGKIAVTPMKDWGELR